MNNKTIAIIVAAIIVVAAVGVYAYVAVPRPDETKLRIATTTSLEDTGLLKELEAAFERKYPGVDVHIISAGTGIAIEHGERGDVDMLLVHDKARETKFVEEGFGVNRTEFGFNHFWIVGPANDPAGIRELNSTEAFRRIAEEGKVFVSRGDDSGTHAREKKIWNASGIDINQARGPWYIESGRGMGDTLVLANEKNAYTISDLGTFLRFSVPGKIELVPLVTTGRDLLNVYTAIPVNPQKHPRTNIEAANNFVNLLHSPEGQEIIGNFGKLEFGEPLFVPVPTHPVPALIVPLLISVPAHS
ncbi:MAG: substrate-binding domain-containing protein [Methanobacteriaceae archaeon]|jgi:tungstate transport system substrate-binding protein